MGQIKCLTEYRGIQRAQAVIGLQHRLFVLQGEVGLRRIHLPTVLRRCRREAIFFDLWPTCGWRQRAAQTGRWRRRDVGTQPVRCR